MASTSSLVFLVLCMLLCSTKGDNEITNISCDSVRRMFVMKGIGSSHLALESPTKGDELEICPSSTTCCSKGMEEKYLHHVQKDLKTMLQSSGSYIRTMISSSIAKFKGTFVDMVQAAENSTTSIFTEVYQVIESTARVPLGQLFADLLAYISGQDVDLEDRVNAFFDSLFPLAYHNSVNSRHREFSETFQECLREVQGEVRPFGDLPDAIVQHVTRSFEAARTLLHALEVGVEILNATEHMNFGQECRAALVKLSFCPQCQGIEGTRPCAGLCLNTMRGCLASVSELDTSWAEYISALERLTSGMVGTYNIEQVLDTLDTKISETMLYVMENTPEITKRVKLKCGHLRRVTREASSSASQAAPRISIKPSVGDSSLYIQLQVFVQKVAETKLFYSNLADDLCNQNGLFPSHNSNHDCWNGQEVGEYSKTVSGIGIATQKYNPEMRPPKTREASVDTLIEKLQHITQVLTTRVTSVPQSDESAIAEGSGSGNYWRSDDEDYGGGSGSGDFGNKDEKTDLHFERSDNGSGDNVGSATTSSISNVLLWLSIAIVVSLYHGH